MIYIISDAAIQLCPCSVKAAIKIGKQIGVTVFFSRSFFLQKIYGKRMGHGLLIPVRNHGPYS